MAAHAEPVIPGLLIEQKFPVCGIMSSVAGKTNQVALNAQHDFLTAAPGFRYRHCAVGPYVDWVREPFGVGVIGLFRLFCVTDFTQYRWRG